MKKLNLFPVTSVDELAHPDAPEALDLNSSALSFFTDFRETEPLVIDATVSAPEALKMMISTHVRMKLVVDGEGHFTGIITADDLTEQEILVRAGISRSARHEVTVSDLMTRKKELLALDIEEVSKSNIRDIIHFLKDNARQHCLVIASDTHQICGIFSASDISRKLKLPINIHEQSSFYRVFSAVS